MRDAQTVTGGGTHTARSETAKVKIAVYRRVADLSPD